MDQRDWGGGALRGRFRARVIYESVQRPKLLGHHYPFQRIWLFFDPPENVLLSLQSKKHYIEGGGG